MNCQLILAVLLFLQFSHPCTSDIIFSLVAICRYKHCPSSTCFAEWEKKYHQKLLACWFEGSNADNGLMCDHAAQNETSIMMHYYPEMVKMNQLPSDTSVELRGVLGKDPRTYASQKLGKEIVKKNIDNMKGVLKVELEKIK